MALLWSPLAHAVDPERRFAQLAHDRWSMDDGLPFPGGYHLALDAEGYLWLGSMAGLARFDGQRFTVHDRANTPAMPGNLIRGMATDAQGRLWVGTERGVMFREHGQFTALPAMAGKNVTVVGLDRQRAVLLSNDEAVFRVRADLALEQVANLKSVHLHAEHHGSWYASANRLHHAVDGRFIAQELPGLGNGHVNTLLSHDGRLLAGTTAGLYLLDRGRWQRHPDPALHKRILAMTADAHGTVWITVELSLLRLRQGRIIEEIDISGFAQATRDMLVDPSGSLWLASHVDGLHRLWDGVGDYLPIPYDAAQSQFMWAVTLWQQQIYTAGTYGLTRLQDGQQVHLPGSTGLPIIYSLLPEADTLWLGTVRGVYRFDGQRARPVPELAAINDTRSNTFLRTADGTLWIGTSRGLYRLPPGQPLQRISGQDNSTHGEIRTLLQTRSGHILASGDQGLWQLHGNRLLPLPGPAAAGGLYALLELDDGRLLAGDRGKGQLYLRDGQRWLSLDRQRGIPHNEVYALVADPQGGVLVSGLRGAYRLDASQLRLASQHPTAMLQIQPGLTLNRRDAPGQQAVCCLGGGDARGLLHQGRYYLPSSRGLFTLTTPLAGSHGSSVPRIERINSTRASHLPGTATLSLSEHERDLRIDFSVLNLSPLHWPRVLYRLHGYDRQWQALPAGAAPQIRYTNLPAGTYRFEVTDTNGGARSAVQSLHIAPAFHQTYRFAALLVIASLALLALTLWLGNVWHRRKRQQLERLVAHRTQDLARANDRLDALARTDPLTGLNNRRHAAREIPQRLAGSELPAHAPRHLFVLMDVDHFKAINDSHGHDVGDAVLVEIAGRLRQHLRQGDCLARWGGEEFLMVCFALPETEHAALAERLLAAVNQTPIIVDGTPPLRVTVSLGLALADATQWKDRVREADIALYASKSTGRNRWTLYGAPLTAHPGDVAPGLACAPPQPH